MIRIIILTQFISYRDKFKDYFCSTLKDYYLDE